MATLDLRLAHPLRSFTLELELKVERETVALVGPSGAGKSSVLRAVAGLLRPERGKISLGDEVWLDRAARVDLPPERRSVGLVFQEYALFPHLTVRENIAFGGKERVNELLERLRIEHLGSARPDDLSGGERQRVALARALARNPGVLLLDEPLSALDAHTRSAVRSELEILLRELALPTVLVTHDFEDAIALASRVGVMVDGRVLQVGSPTELISAPVDPFVASFTGANLVRGVAAPGLDGLTEVALESGGVAYSTDAEFGRVGVAVYPWEISIGREPPGDSAVNHLRAPIASLVTLGNRARVRVGPFTAEVTAASVGRLGLAEGEIVVASFKATATRLLPLPGRSRPESSL
jgi:molybdate transport system ATP-binding protein